MNVDYESFDRSNSCTVNKLLQSNGGSELYAYWRKIILWTIAILLTICFFIYAISNICWPDLSMDACCLTQKTFGRYCFCEGDNHQSPVRQFINSWSSLSFVAVAIYMLFYYPVLIQGDKSSLHILILAFITVLVGFSGWLYHASLTLLGERMEAVTNLLLVFWLVLFAILRLWRALKKDIDFWVAFTRFFIYGAIIIVFIGLLVPRWCRVIWFFLSLAFLVLIVIELFIFVYCKLTLKLLPKLVLPLVYFFFGVLAWFLDWFVCLFGGFFIFQLHAVFHVFISLALFFWVKYWFIVFDFNDVTVKEKV
ncbi:hypothetical protein P9112_009299 [Eukaryota sp. TZLM1-RC]